MVRISGLADAMSDVLSLVRMKGDVVCTGVYAAPWSLGFDLPFAHFHMVQRRSARIWLDDGTELRLEPGDLALLPLGLCHSLSSNSALAPSPSPRRLPVRVRWLATFTALPVRVRRPKSSAADFLLAVCWPRDCLASCPG